jgi:hypothetical protein
MRRNLRISSTYTRYTLAAAATSASATTTSVQPVFR